MPELDIEQIKKALPHRYPMLLLDRVVDYTPGESLTAIKNVTINEPFFQGHFPQRPIMPGVLIIEAMAQATAVLGLLSEEGSRHWNKLYYLVGVDKARFRKTVGPGDQLVLEVKFVALRRNIWRFSCTAKVNDITVADADLLTTIADQET
ncbi:MAG: 3-hydroxyacyl-ACP dehydratase FabZ [Gammaproteobacteria bacterium]|nr:3-hydroxyacyl-ACP dehydratase FabZ [Gammaproteobacteria bacterium]